MNKNVQHKGKTIQKEKWEEVWNTLIILEKDKENHLLFLYPWISITHSTSKSVLSQQIENTEQKNKHNCLKYREYMVMRYPGLSQNRRRTILRASRIGGLLWDTVLCKWQGSYTHDTSITLLFKEDLSNDNSINIEGENLTGFHLKIKKHSQGMITERENDSLPGWAFNWNQETIYIQATKMN